MQNINILLFVVAPFFWLTVYKEQEDHAVTGNNRTMHGTCTESLHLILRQCSEQKEH